MEYHSTPYSLNNFPSIFLIRIENQTHTFETEERKNVLATKRSVTRTISNFNEKTTSFDNDSHHRGNDGVDAQEYISKRGKSTRGLLKDEQHYNKIIQPPGQLSEPNLNSLDYDNEILEFNDKFGEQIDKFIVYLFVLFVMINIAVG